MVKEWELRKSGEFRINGRERKYAGYVLCMGLILVLTLEGGEYLSNQRSVWRKQADVIICRSKRAFFMCLPLEEQRKMLHNEWRVKSYQPIFIFWSPSDALKPRISVMFLIWLYDILRVSRELLLTQSQSVKYCWLKISSSSSSSSIPEDLDFVSRMDLATVTVYELPGY
jgi:hypothetical protein